MGRLGVGNGWGCSRADPRPVMALNNTAKTPMLAGPVIRHRERVGGLVQLDVVIDASESMSLPDPEMVPGRKLLVAERLGWFPASDVLDATATSNELGKTAGKDARQNKATFASALGLEAARAEARACVTRSVARLEEAGIASGLLGGLAEFIVERRS